MPKPRNRSREARAKGNVMTTVELTPEARREIELVRAVLISRTGRGTLSQALEWLIREGATRIAATK